MTSEKINEIEILKRKPLLSKKEYHLLTGISVPTITRLALDGQIPSRKIGRAVRLVNNLN